MDTEPLTTGEVAERADVNVQTVRYYERRGLLPEPPRSSGGFRQYSPDYVDRIRFIKRAQELGFRWRPRSEIFGASGIRSTNWSRPARDTGRRASVLFCTRSRNRPEATGPSQRSSPLMQGGRSRLTDIFSE